ncbi:hypothetical protein [Latilactobacillus curvatus]
MKTLIRNILDIDVDGLNGVNHYTVKGMYDVMDADGFATIKHELVARFDLTWEQIDNAGGVDIINEAITNKYNIEKF